MPKKDEQNAQPQNINAVAEQRVEQVQDIELDDPEKQEEKELLDGFLEGASLNGWDAKGEDKAFLVEVFHAANQPKAGAALKDAALAITSDPLPEVERDSAKYDWIRSIKNELVAPNKESHLWKVMEAAEKRYQPHANEVQADAEPLAEQRAEVDNIVQHRQIRDEPQFGDQKYTDTFLEKADRNGWDAEGADRDFLIQAYRAASAPGASESVIDAVKRLESTALDPEKKGAAQYGHVREIKGAVESLGENLNRESKLWKAMEAAEQRYQAFAPKEQPQVQQEEPRQQRQIGEHIVRNRQIVDSFRRDEPKFGDPGYLDTFIANAGRNGWDISENSRDRKLLTEMYRAATDPQHPNPALAKVVRNIEGNALNKQFANADKHDLAAVVLASLEQNPLAADNPLMQALREVLFAYTVDSLKRQQSLSGQLAAERMQREEEEALEQERNARRRQQQNTLQTEATPQRNDPGFGDEEEPEPETERKYKNKRFRNQEQIKALEKSDVRKRSQSLLGDLKDEAGDLAATRRIAGGSSNEHEEMLKSVGKLMLASAAQNYSAMDKADALMEARKKTQEYITKKRGNNIDPDWTPKTGMGKKRFEAANNTLDRINEEIDSLGLNGIYSKIHDLQDDLGAKHWHGMGGSTQEHRNLMKKVEKLKRSCLVEEPGYSPEKKAKALREAKKAAQEYIRKKRGNHPEGWIPRTGMGAKRFKAAEALIEEIDKEMAELGISDEPEAEQELTQNKRKSLNRHYKNQWRRGGAAPENRNPNRQNRPAQQQLWPDRDPASVEPYQKAIRGLMERMSQASYQDLTENFQKYKAEMLQYLTPMVAKKAVYAPTVTQDPNYARNSELPKKEKALEGALRNGGYPEFNTLVRIMQSPDALMKVGKLAVSGKGNALMNQIVKLPKTPLVRPAATNTANRQRNLNMN